MEKEIIAEVEKILQRLGLPSYLKDGIVKKIQENAERVVDLRKVLNNPAKPEELPLIRKQAARDVLAQLEELQKKGKEKFVRSYLNKIR